MFQNIALIDTLSHFFFLEEEEWREKDESFSALLQWPFYHFAETFKYAAGFHNALFQSEYAGNADMLSCFRTSLLKVSPHTTALLESES